MTTEADVERRIDIGWVRVDGRFRKDLGDIEKLARSIAEQGLINAITVTPSGRLLAGERRLRACQKLGWAQIPARIVEDLDSAALRLRVERDENTERKPMTPEELVRLGRALEELERPRAAARKAQAPGAPRGEKVSSGHLTGREEPAETRVVVGEALGMSGTTYVRAKTVVAAAEDTTLPADERAVAKQALAEMNATGNISGAFEKVRKVRDKRLNAPQARTIDDPKKQRRAITGAVANLSGTTHVLRQIDTIHTSITSEEAAQWVGDLSEARRVIEVLIKRLKERING